MVCVGVARVYQSLRTYPVLCGVLGVSARGEKRILMQ